MTSDLTAMTWTHRHSVHVPTNSHCPADKVSGSNNRQVGHYEHLLHQQTDLESYKASGPFYSGRFCHSQFSSLTIITLTIQTCIHQGPTTSSKRVSPLQTTGQGRKPHPPANDKDLKHNTVEYNTRQQNTHWSLERKTARCYTSFTEKPRN